MVTGLLERLFALAWALPGGWWYWSSRAQAAPLRRSQADVIAAPVSRARLEPARLVLGKRRFAHRTHDSHNFFATLQIEDFAGLRSTLGFTIVNALFDETVQRLNQVISDIAFGRAANGTIEFAFNAPSADGAADLLARCLSQVERPFEISGMRLRIRGRIAFLSSGAPASASELPHKALAALADGRERRKRIICAQGAFAQTGALDDREILRALPAALAADELTLSYQPKFDCRTQGFGSAEALLRWSSPLMGAVPTQHLVELAERTGMIHEITSWVLRQVVRDQAVLRAGGFDLTLFANVSGPLLTCPAFIAEAMAVIEAAPGRLGLEITETAVIDDPDTAITNIAAFAEAGVPIAIDDFGSGVSSLAYLKRLPADELKIDRLFIDGLSRSHRDPLIVRSAIDLAHALEMRVTAEGVDDPMCFSLLQMMGCDQLQGYYIARPMPLFELIGFLRSDARDWSQPTIAKLAGGRLGIRPVTSS